VRAAWAGSIGRATGRGAALGAVLVGLASIVLLVPVLELWNLDPSVPIASVYEPANSYVYSLDAPFYVMLAKGGIDHFWFLSNPNLGWPLGQQVHDLPQSLDNLNLLSLKVLGVVFGDVGTTVNVFFMLTFAAVAVSAFLVLRALRVSTPTSFVVALLYTFLPYHFARGAPHLFLSAYWVVPLAVYLVLRVASDRAPFTYARDSRRGFGVRVFDRAGIGWLFACAAIASTGAYYGVFTALFVVAVVVIDFAVNRRRRTLVSGAIALGVIAIVAFVNLLPGFIYWAEHGTNDKLVRRLPYETEAEGLKVSQLLLPIDGHRFGPFAETQADSTRFTPVPSEKGQHLGVIGALGFLAVLAALLLAARRRRLDDDADARRPTRAPHDASARAPPDPNAPTAPHLESSATPDDGLAPNVVMRTLGVLTVVAILLGTVSGFSLLISGAGFRDIRAWNRIVVFVAFFAFLAVAYGLDWLGNRLPDRRWRAPVMGLVLVAVLVFGVLDQVSPAAIPDYSATKARWESDAAFVADIERTLPAGAAVFELPYRYFPEAPTAGNLGPYDLVRGYLHSDDLAWSWGGVRGRGADWQQNVVQHPVDEFLDRITAVGFRGLLLDRAAGDALAPGGTPTEDEITAALGEEPTVSRDGELVFWDLRARARELRDELGVDGVAHLRRETLADVPEVRAQGS
jgi:hypothetical protein